jgi:hypothetical protein
MLKDLKESLSNARKPDTTHVRRAFQAYTARPCEFGNVKYERANYRRPTGEGVHTEPTKADFERYRSYLRAARDHIDETLDAMEMHLANDPRLVDVEGMKRAAFAIDTDVTPGSEWLGPSNLPHVAPACSSLNMAITQAADCGLLPRDPGTPWNTKAVKPTLLDKAIAAFEGDRKLTTMITIGRIDESFQRGADAVEMPEPTPLPFRRGDRVKVVGGSGAGQSGTVKVISDITGLVTVETFDPGGAGMLRTSALNLEKIDGTL